MFIIFGAWLFFFILVCGIGLGFVTYFLKLVGGNNKIEIDLFTLFWLGLAFTILLLQFYSISYPIDGKVYIIFGSIFVLSLVYAKEGIKLLINKLFKINLLARKNIAFIILSILVVLTLLYSASLKVVWYDTHLYHLNAVRWISDYPVVPGLANLHIRLGISSSLFLFAALTDTWILTSSSSHIALSLLLAVAVVQWLYVMVRQKSSVQEKIFCSLTLPFLIRGAWSIEVASLSTDLGMAIVFLVFLLEMLKKNSLKLLIISMLGALAITFKLTGLLVAPFLFLILLRQAVGKQISIRRKKIAIFSSIFTLILILGFVARNLILSGWLFYPAPVGKLNFSWSVPKNTTVFLSERIKTWAQVPGGNYIETLNLSFQEWLIPWFGRYQNSIELRIFSISIILMIAIYGSENLYKIGKLLGREWLILVSITLGSIVVWFLAAPSLRFGSVFFWALFALLATPLIIFLTKKFRFNELPIILSLILIILIAPNGPEFDEKLKLFELKKESSRLVRATVGSPDGEYPELIIWVPVRGDRCGNSQLPCSNKPVKLRQRVPGDFSKGFLPFEK